jgi:hypothetical protein
LIGLPLAANSQIYVISVCLVEKYTPLAMTGRIRRHCELLIFFKQTSRNDGLDFFAALARTSKALVIANEVKQSRSLVMSIQ